MIRIIIADDHQMFIDGVKALLKPNKSVSIVDEAHNGTELLEILSTKEAELVLMDINMQGMDGIAATIEVRKLYPELKILMLTMHNSSDHIEKVLRAGAHGYILKNTGKEELESAIAKIMNGESFFSQEVTARIMDRLQGKKQSTTDPMYIELTGREKDVLKLIALEFTSNEIADKLCISYHTVETHRKNLISKLQVKNIAGLVKYALQHGLADE